MYLSLECFAPEVTTLGESPVWCPVRSGLFWLDILAQRLYFRHELEGETVHWELPCVCSALFLLKSPQVVLLLSEAGLGTFSLDTGNFSIIATSSSENAHMRGNDAGIAPDGHIWFGTMQKLPTELAGSIYKAGLGPCISSRSHAVGIPNTFIWSGNGKWLIHADSLLKKIYKSPFTDGEADFTCTEALVDLQEKGIDPDGSAMDSEDCFWNAQWGGGLIARYDLQGRHLESIALPAIQPTSCAFGGADLRTLYITTATAGMSPEALAAYPGSGQVFRIRLETPGQPLPHCIFYEIY
jgi:sugar lactone lactonase YvrE